MKTVAEGKENIRKLLGAQRISAKQVHYRLMHYTISAECADGVLLLNVITGKLLLLSPDEAHVLQSLPAQAEQIEASQIAMDLMRDYFLVPMDYSEKSTVDKLRMLMGLVFAPKGINSYTILTTTNCNARCFYCYQAGRAHIDMSEQTANELVDYMLAHKDPEKPLSLHWYGGEPLMRMSRIEQVCMRLREHGLEYKSRMTSNGYLLTEEIVCRAVDDWHLKRVQITLDGTEEVYNRAKAFVVSDTNAYQRVLTNIGLLADHGVTVSVRLNLGQHNYDDLALLVEELAGLFAGNKHVSVYVHVLFEGMGFEPIQRTEGVNDELCKRQIELESLIRDLSLSRPSRSLPSLDVYCCMADSPGTMVVYPDGRLFKCQHTDLGDVYGTLAEGITQKNNIDKFKERLVVEECDTCPLYPSCIKLKECLSSRSDKCNSLLRQDVLKKHLLAMQNIYACR